MKQGRAGAGVGGEGAQIGDEGEGRKEGEAEAVSRFTSSHPALQDSGHNDTDVWAPQLSAMTTGSSKCTQGAQSAFLFWLNFMAAEGREQTSGTIVPESALKDFAINAFGRWKKMVKNDGCTALAEQVQPIRP